MVGERKGRTTSKRPIRENYREKAGKNEAGSSIFRSECCLKKKGFWGWGVGVVFVSLVGGGLGGAALPSWASRTGIVPERGKSAEGDSTCKSLPTIAGLGAL